MSNLNKSLENFYQQKNYKEAIELLKANPDEFETSEFHYNLGTYYLKDSNPQMARYHFEISRKLGFNSSMLDQNMEIAKERLDLINVEKPYEAEYKVLQGLDDLSKDWFISFLLVFTLLSIIVFRKSKSISLAVLLLILAVLPIGAREYFDKKFTRAVVTTSTSAFDGPSKIYDEVSELPLGMKVYLTVQRNDSWFYIEYPETYRGWVNYSNLNPIQEKKDVY